MKNFESLFSKYKGQEFDSIFAFFPPILGDFDQIFKNIAENTIDGFDSWTFEQQRFKDRHRSSSVTKLKNYLNYTFVRLLDLEKADPGKYFKYSKDRSWICFNTGLQNDKESDLIATFQANKPPPGNPDRPIQNWVFSGCFAPNDSVFLRYFGTDVPDLACYSKDSLDSVFETSFKL